MWIIHEMESKYCWCRRHASTNDKACWNTDLTKLDSGVLPRTITQLSLFRFTRNLLDLVFKVVQNQTFQAPLGLEMWWKGGSEIIENADIVKTYQTAPNLVPKEHLKLGLVVVLFPASSPDVPRASPGRVPGPKACQLELEISCPKTSLDRDFNRFDCDALIWFEASSNYFNAPHRR